jgi:formate hydrogenlyase subunit 6/NADH:ubiquinone oxidoreductase subunit I
MWKLLIKHSWFLLSAIPKSLRSPPFTVEYPFVVKSLPSSARTSIRNNFKECTGCLKCEQTCPVKAIGIDGFEYSKTMRRPVSSGGIPFEREVESFRLDYSQCVYCGLCVQVCPTGALGFTKSFSKPEVAQKNLLVDLVHVPRSVRSGTVYEV